MLLGISSPKVQTELSEQTYRMPPRRGNGFASEFVHLQTATLFPHAELFEGFSFGDVKAAS